jgi:hypothetical protein
MQIKLRKYDDKYFGYFEDKKTAMKYLENLARYYSENKEKVSINNIIRRERKQGIKLNYYTLKKYFEQLGVPEILRYVKKKDKYQSFKLSEDILDNLRTLPNQRRFLEFMLRVGLGLPSDDLLLFLDDKVRVFFYKEKELNAVVIGPIEKRDENMIRGLIRSARIEGMPIIKKFAITFNYRTYGGNL